MDDDGAFIREGLDALGLSGLIVEHINPSPVDLSAALLSPKITTFVRDFYADDFAFIGGLTEVSK
jgi:hypothetical protein